MPMHTLQRYARLGETPSSNAEVPVRTVSVCRGGTLLMMRWRAGVGGLACTGACMPSQPQWSTHMLGHDTLCNGTATLLSHLMTTKTYSVFHRTFTLQAYKWSEGGGEGSHGRGWGNDSKRTASVERSSVPPFNLTALDPIAKAAVPSQGSVQPTIEAEIKGGKARTHLERPNCKLTAKR